MSVLCFEHRLPCQCFKQKVSLAGGPEILLARHAAKKIVAMADGTSASVTLSPRALNDLALVAASYLAVGDALVDFMGTALTEARMAELVNIVAKLKEAGFGQH
jgi:hypothetical protein